MYIKSKAIPVHTTKACMESRSTSPLILNLSTRWNFTLRPLNPQEMVTVPFEKDAGLATEPVWTFG